MNRFNRTIAVLVVSLLLPALASAQDAKPPYGPPIKLALAKKVAAAAEAEAAKNKWDVIITIVDSGANLVLLHRMDNAQIGSIEVSQGKAKTAVRFRRPSKAFQDAIAEGGVNLKLLALPGALPFDGGHPIIQNGKIIGGIGVSGVSSDQDTLIALAGLKALPKPKKKDK